MGEDLFTLGGAEQEGGESKRDQIEDQQCPWEGQLICDIDVATVQKYWFCKAYGVGQCVDRHKRLPNNKLQDAKNHTQQASSLEGARKAEEKDEGYGNDY